MPIEIDYKRIRMSPIPMLDWTADESFYYRATWQLKFLWLPRRCALSGKWVWLEFAYQGTAVWTGPGSPVIEYKWHKSTEHIIWQLKHGV